MRESSKNLPLSLGVGCAGNRRFSAATRPLVPHNPLGKVVGEPPNLFRCVLQKEGGRTDPHDRRFPARPAPRDKDKLWSSRRLTAKLRFRKQVRGHGSRDLATELGCSAANAGSCWVDLCLGWCVDFCVDFSVDLCADFCVDLCSDFSVDFCVDFRSSLFLLLNLGVRYTVWILVFPGPESGNPRINACGNQCTNLHDQSTRELTHYVDAPDRPEGNRTASK